MSRTRTRLAVLLAPLMTMVMPAATDAGSLTPPAGPVAPAYKTLTEVEPRIAINLANTPGDANSVFRITQPGSYYLTGNLQGLPGRHGIEVVVGFVTLDLNGHSLVGVPGTLDGVSALGNFVTVRDGRVSGWGGDGIHAAGSEAQVSDVQAFANSGDGIRVGVLSRISGCTASGNGGAGIRAFVGLGVVADCTAFGNDLSGIAPGAGSALERCTAYFNTGDGITLGADCTVSRCTAVDNFGDGIAAPGDCVISGCTATLNGLSGVFAGFSSTVVDCAANINGSDGISAGGYCTIARCTTDGNEGSGISGGVRTHISRCSASDNAGDGVLVTENCLVSSNLCGGNGSDAGDGAGIHATGGDNRIEGNNCADADRGIDVDAAGNFIVRNVCSGNATNWDVAAGNVCLVVSAAAGGAIVGDAGGVAPGSTDPNANFTY